MAIIITSEGGFRRDPSTPDTITDAAKQTVVDLTRRRPQLKLAEALATIFGSSLPVGQRIDQFLSLDFSGRPGAPELRERQQRIRERLAKLRAAPRAAQRPGLFHFSPAGYRERMIGVFGANVNRDERRAKATGASALAVSLGQSFHRRVKPLYTSDRADVVYGRGGHEGYDANAYSKGYRSKFGGAKWKDAGARVVYAAHPKCRGAGEVVIETSRGTEVARFPLPSREGLTFKGLVDGDLYGRQRVIAGLTVVERHGLKKIRGQNRQAIYRTGYAVLLTDGTWEHGDSIRSIRVELDRKAAVRRAEQERKALDARLARAARLVARLCPSLTVTHDDRRAVGYCDAGTKGFLERYGLATRETVTVGELRSLDRPEVERVIQHAARRIAQTRFAAAN